MSIFPYSLKSAILTFTTQQASRPLSLAPAKNEVMPLWQASTRLTSASDIHSVCNEVTERQRQECGHLDNGRES